METISHFHISVVFVIFSFLAPLPIFPNSNFFKNTLTHHLIRILLLHLAFHLSIFNYFWMLVLLRFIRTNPVNFVL